MVGEKISVGVTMAEKIASIRILVVDDDSTCLAVVAAMLKLFDYQVTTAQDPVEALATLRMNHELFDLVLCDVHMPSMSGFEFQKQVVQEFKLPVVLMSSDNEQTSVLEGSENGAYLYIVKPPTKNDLSNLWQFAISSKNGKSLMCTERGTSCLGNLRNNSLDDDNDDDDTQSVSSINREHLKRRFPIDDVEERVEDGNPNSPKRSKLIWTATLHNKFLDAIRIIGFGRAVPKKILDYMNVPGLTRENIASHLQKYRIYLRKVAETNNSMKHGMPQTWNDKPLRSTFSWSQVPSLASKNILLNFSSSSRSLLQEQAIALASNLNQGNHVSLATNSQFPGAQVLNSFNTLSSNNIIQPMNSTIGANSIQSNNTTLDMNPIPIHPLINTNSTNFIPYDPTTLFSSEINILESSMLGINQQKNNNNNNQNMLRAIDLTNQGDLTITSMHLLSPTSNFDQFGMINNQQVRVGPMMMANNLQGQEQTTMMQMGVASGIPTNACNNNRLFGLSNDMIMTNQTFGLLHEFNQGAPFFNYDALGTNLIHGGIQQRNQSVDPFFNYNALESNFINGGIQQESQHFTFNNYDPIVGNQFVEQNENVPNSISIPNEGVLVANSTSDIIPVAQQNNPEYEEMSNFNFSNESPSLLQDRASNNNIDDFSLDGIDDLVAFLTSFEANNGSNNAML